MASSQQPGRNSPCPCGSGKKYKRCCEGTDQTDQDDGWPAPPRRSRRLTIVLSAVIVALLTAWITMGVLSIEQGSTTAGGTGQPAEDTPDPWAYDAANNRHWHPGHGHWHDGPPPAGVTTQHEQAPPSEAASPEPWEYDAANNRHWHPGHNHWHQGPPPQGR